jgi:hypothetical protein
VKTVSNPQELPGPENESRYKPFWSGQAELRGRTTRMLRG